MTFRYPDILERVSEAPTWWWRGVPRYGTFHPSMVRLGDGEVVLVAAACQQCGHRYRVCATGPGKHWTFGDRIEVGASVGIGDAPDGCCGWSINYNLREHSVEEFWSCQDNEWIRQPILEQPLLDCATAHVLCLEEKLKQASVFAEWERSYRILDLDGMIDLLPKIGLPPDSAERIAQNWKAVACDIDQMFHPQRARLMKSEFFAGVLVGEPWHIA